MQDSKRAFSLLEVVIAVALFSGGILVLLALLPSVLQRSADSNDSLTALHLPEQVHTELLRLGGINPVANIGGQLVDLGQTTDASLRLVAARSGEDVRALGTDTRDKFFLIELFRFTSGQLAYNSSASSLAIQVRVSWPYLPPEASIPVALENRNQVTFNLSLTR